MSRPPIKTFEINLPNFPPQLYSARTRGRALSRCWGDYQICHECSFKDFLRLARARVTDNPPGIGERILVGGLPATRVIGFGQYVHFMRDDSDEIFCSHPLDVRPAP